MITIKQMSGTSVVRQAKRALRADASAAYNKGEARLGVISNGCLTAMSGALMTLNMGKGPVTAGFWGVITAITTTITGIRMKEFISASKTKKQTSKALDNIVNKKDFIDIINRYMRINGKKELTSEQFLKAYKKVDKTEFIG